MREASTWDSGEETAMLGMELEARREEGDMVASRFIRTMGWA